jgi:hypothetical protein
MLNIIALAFRSDRRQSAISGETRGQRRPWLRAATAAHRYTQRLGGVRRVREVQKSVPLDHFPQGRPAADSAEGSIVRPGHRTVNVLAPAAAALLGLLSSPMLAQGPSTTFVAAAQQDRAAVGRVVGRVIDGQTSRPIEQAQVILPATNLQAVTDLDGRYNLGPVPVGVVDLTIRRVGYTAKVVTSVEVSSREVTTLDIALFPVAVSLEAIEVTAAAERGTTAEMLDVRRTSSAVLDAIGQAEIQALPASDAADVATRMTGVTVNEGRYVYIRGLGDRYSQTSFNGSPLPSPEPERSVVPLDLFPSGFLETVSAQKTYTPDQPAEFSGGTMQIDTKDFPNEFGGSIGIGTSVNTISHFRDDFLDYTGGSRDWLGEDDGTRGLPPTVANDLGGIKGDRLPADPAALIAIGQEMQREFTPTQRSTPINRNLDLAVGTRTYLFGLETGLLGGFTYDDNYSYREDEIERKFRTSGFDPAIPAENRTPNVDYTFNRGLRTVRIGALANLAVMLSPTNKLSFKGTFSRNTDDEARQYFGLNREDLDGYVQSDRLRFVQQELYWGQVSGEHGTIFNSRLEWRANLAQARRDEPGLRETIYLNTDVNDTDATPFLENVGESGRYLWSELRDDDFNAGLDWTIPFSVWSDNEASVKVGGAYRDRTRDFGARRLSWNFLGGIVTNIDSVLIDDAIVGSPPGPNEFRIRDVVEPGDVYLAEDRRTAGYMMFDMQLSRDLRTMFGARVETYDLLIDSRGDTLSEVDQVDVLPAVSLVYELNRRMNVRVAASQTVDRPEFRELAPFQFTEASSLRQLYGNPDLVPATIRSLDLRWDWFRRPGELISVSGFYKQMDKPIEQVFIAAASTAYSFQNAVDANLFGVELDVRQRLDFLAYGLANFSFLGNASIVRSTVNVIESGVFQPTNLERALQGQADYSLNLGMLYQSTYGGTEIGLFYNRQGDKIAAAGGFGVPDVVERGRNVLDAQWKQRLTGSLRLKVRASNLLNAPYLWEQEANGIVQIQRRYEEGVTFSAGFTWDF